MEKINVVFKGVARGSAVKDKMAFKSANSRYFFVDGCDNKRKKGDIAIISVVGRKVENVKWRNT